MNKSKQVIESNNLNHSAKQRRRGPRGGVTKPFPDRLYEMLTNVEKSTLSHIVSWQPHGRCFLVHKPKDFVAKVMPKYFNQTKLTSFQRQLNLYGFSRLTSGADRGGYYHELFLRGRPNLTKSMLRTRIKGVAAKSAIGSTKEPNFYAMIPMIAVQKHDDNDNESTTSDKSRQANMNKIKSNFSSPREQNIPNKYEDIPLLPPLSLPKEIITVNAAKPTTTSRCSSPPALVTPPYSPRRTGTAFEESDMRDLKLDQSFKVSSHQQDDLIFFEGKKFYYLESTSLSLPNTCDEKSALNSEGIQIWSEADNMLVDTFSDNFLLEAKAL